MRYYDSSSEDEAPTSRLNFDGEPDKDIYAHLPKLVDGVTKGPVTKKTTLVALYQCKPRVGIDSTLISNLTGITRPEVTCALGEGKRADITGLQCSGSHGYHMKLTYNKLLLAPRLRLTCTFYDNGSSYLQLVLEFHFNDFFAPDTGIREYNHSNGTIEFTSRGASCVHGFNFISSPSVRSKFDEKDLEIIRTLRSYIRPRERHPVRIDLDERNVCSADKETLRKVRSRLPGGSGILLPSIGKHEYFCFGQKGGNIVSRIHCMSMPEALMLGSPRNCMVSLHSEDTYNTFKEAQVELAYSAVMQHFEGWESLRLWASTHHMGKLFVKGTFPVLAVNFSNFCKLGSATQDLHYQLPRELAAEMEWFWYCFGRTQKCAGVLMSNTAGLPTGYDAYFMITSPSLKVFTKIWKERKSLENALLAVKFKPHYPCFNYGCQLETVARLSQKSSHRWYQILLNQTHEAIAKYDITAASKVSPEDKAKADAWLLAWMKPNKAQLSVIEGIKCATGGMIIILGPAGTGKTRLQQALAVYFYMLGFHILALSPANSNANHLAVELDKMKEELSELDSSFNLDFNRLFPGSRELILNDMTEKQAERRKVGHEERAVIPFNEILVALDERQKERNVAKKYGVVEAVINTAEQDHRPGTAIIVRREDGVPDENGSDSEMVNPWGLVREIIRKHRTGTLDLKDKPRREERYRAAYTACKGQIMRRNRFMVTTTTNVRTSEMLLNWAAKEKDTGIPLIGVVVFVDEACKDQEVNVWSGVVCEKWADLVKGVFLFGDDKQLKPCNTSSKDKVVFNAFSERLDISLPSRLTRENFPHYRLTEQRRMHAALNAFPNRTIYNDLLTEGPGMRDVLGSKKSGFAKVLRDIMLHSKSLTPQDQEAYQDLEKADASLRLHWVEVKGTRKRASPKRPTLVVEEHVDVFFKQIFWMLHAYFREKKESMEENVMIICAYAGAIGKYEETIDQILEQNPNLTKADTPRILTVDASQGQESFMVLFDGSFQHGDIVGFMNDPGRANVAITRAKEVFWIIGGRMDNGLRKSAATPNLLTQYKREMDQERRVHQFS